MVWNSNCDHFTYISFKKYLGSKDLKTSCILAHPRARAPLLFCPPWGILKYKICIGENSPKFTGNAPALFRALRRQCSFTSNMVYLKLKSCTEYNTVTRLFEIHYDIYLVKKGVVFCLFFILKYQFVHQNCNSQLGIVAWNQASKKVTFRIIQFFVFVFYWMKFWFISIHYPGILVLF